MDLLKSKGRKQTLHALIKRIMHFFVTLTVTNLKSIQGGDRVKAQVYYIFRD